MAAVKQGTLISGTYAGAILISSYTLCVGDGLPYQYTFIANVLNAYQSIIQVMVQPVATYTSAINIDVLTSPIFPTTNQAQWNLQQVITVPLPSSGTYTNGYSYSTSVLIQQPVAYVWINPETISSSVQYEITITQQSIYG